MTLRYMLIQGELTMGHRLQAAIVTTALAGSLLLNSSAAHAHAITLTEMQTLANAMTTVAFDIGHYVTLENLNDLSAVNTVLPYDSIKQNGGVFPILPSQGTFRNRRDFTVGSLKWNGPYVTYQSSRIQTALTPYDQGSLLDQWGSPYYLFNPLGLLRGDQGVITQELYGDQFDRYAIVSLGPDGIKSSDDISYLFGAGLEGSQLTSLSGPDVTLISAPVSAPEYEITAGTSVTLRGINLNPSVDKAVLFGSTVITDVQSWGSRNVVITLPESLTGTDDFTVVLGTQSTRGIRATIVGSDTGVTNWTDY